MVASGKTCRCCRQKRGWIYAGPTYAEQDLDDSLCPWCIADGSAHEMFDVTFVDVAALADDTSPETVAEICERTPGFCSFQSERWPSCCGQPGIFLSPAGITDIRTAYPRMEGELMTYIVHELGISGGSARQMLDDLTRDRSPTAFVFQCEKCARHFGYVDYV